MSSQVQDKPPQTVRPEPASLKLALSFWAIWMAALVLTLVLLWMDHAAREASRGQPPCGPGVRECENVFISPYALIFEIPLIWYALGYLVLLGVSMLLGMFSWQASLAPPVSLIVPVVSLTGLAGAAWAALVMFFSLGTLCLLCLVLQAAYVALFATTVAYAWQDWRHRQYLRWRAGEQTLRTTPIAVVVFFALLGSSSTLLGLNLGHAPKPRPTVRIVVEPQLMIDPISEQLWNQLPVTSGESEEPILLTIRGNLDAPRVLVMFGCPTCPHCRQMSEILKQIQEAHPDELRVDIRFDPLGPCNDRYRKIALEKEHRDACVLARCAMAIAKVAPDVFADYLAWLYDNQGDVPAELAKAEAEARVDAELFRQAVDSDDVWTRSRVDMELATKVQSNSVPRLFVPAGEIYGEVTASRLESLLARQFGWGQPSIQAGEGESVWVAARKLELLVQRAANLAAA
ncbi:MAG TPA: thioredoxin domain-containing protein, partial [Anaerolineales bacterium]